MQNDPENAQASQGVSRTHSSLTSDAGRMVLSDDPSHRSDSRSNSNRAVVNLANTEYNTGNSDDQRPR